MQSKSTATGLTKHVKGEMVNNKSKKLPENVKVAPKRATRNKTKILISAADFAEDTEQMLK